MFDIQSGIPAVLIFGNPFLPDQINICDSRVYQIGIDKIILGNILVGFQLFIIPLTPDIVQAVKKRHVIVQLDCIMQLIMRLVKIIDFVGVRAGIISASF